MSNITDIDLFNAARTAGVLIVSQAEEDAAIRFGRAVLAMQRAQEAADLRVERSARLIEALTRLRARGHLAESTCADDATNADLRFAATALSDAERATGAPAPVARSDMRAAFEAWTKYDSTLPVDRYPDGSYVDFTTSLMWHAWQAAQKANAPGGAFVEGGSTRDAGPGLAGADDTCAHDFAVQPSSGIKLCAHCGRSEVATHKLAATAPVAQAAIPAGWARADDLVQNSPEVDEALHAFTHDATDDNAVGLVQAILTAAALQPAAQPAPDPVAQPLTREAVLRMAYPIRHGELSEHEEAAALHFARAIEHAHGITGNAA